MFNICLFVCLRCMFDIWPALKELFPDWNRPLMTLLGAQGDRAIQQGIRTQQSFFSLITPLWIQHQLGIKPIKPLGQYWVHPSLAFYNQQEILQSYSQPGAPSGVPTLDTHWASEYNISTLTIYKLEVIWGTTQIRPTRSKRKRVLRA